MLSDFTRNACSSFLLAMPFAIGRINNDVPMYNAIIKLTLPKLNNHSSASALMSSVQLATSPTKTRSTITHHSS